MNGNADDPREIVRKGYDEIAGEYLRWRRFDSATDWALTRVLSELPRNGRVLDLGCGAGRPVTVALARKGFVVGLDLSSTQLSLARRHVPDAALVQADITEVRFRSRSINVVTAFYSLNHIPRDRLALVLRRIESWLRQGGLFVASFGTGDDQGTIDENWFGTPMFFDGFDADYTLELLHACGLHVIDHRIFTQPEHGRMVSFLWVVATPVTGS